MLKRTLLVTLMLFTAGAQSLQKGFAVEGQPLDATSVLTEKKDKVTAVPSITVEVPPATGGDLGGVPAQTFEPAPAPAPTLREASVDPVIAVQPISAFGPEVGGAPAAQPQAEQQPQGEQQPQVGDQQEQSPASSRTQLEEQAQPAPAPPPPPPQVLIEAAERRPDFQYRPGRLEFQVQNSFTGSQTGLTVGAGLDYGATRYVPVGQF